MVGQKKIGAVILVAGVGIPDEEMEKFLEMKRPTIFEQMIVSYQRAGVADIALVTRDGMADKIEQTLHRRGVTFLDIESDSFELAVLKGLSYLSDTCERIFVGDIRFPFFQPDILVMMQKRRAELLGAVYGGMFGDLICTSQACARNICKKLEQQIEESAEMAEGTVRSTGVAAFWKQFGYRIAHIEVENEGILVKVTSAQEYEERRQIFAEKQIRGHVKVSLAVNRSFFGPGVVTLLTQIDRLGSVREACAKTGMSYSKGWKLIHTAEEETGWKIVERMSGGKNGGEAYITERPHDTIKTLYLTNHLLFNGSQGSVYPCKIICHTFRVFSYLICLTSRLHHRATDHRIILQQDHPAIIFGSKHLRHVLKTHTHRFGNTTEIPDYRVKS